MATPSNTPYLSPSGDNGKGESASPSSPPGHGILDPRTGYVYAAADVAAATAAEPWNLAAAVGNEAYHTLVERIHSAPRNQLVAPSTDHPGHCDPLHRSPSAKHKEQPPTSAFQSAAAQSWPQRHPSFDDRPALGERSRADANLPQSAERTLSSGSLSAASDTSLQPSKSIDIETASSTVPHYDPGRDVCLRFEYLTARQTRFVILLMWSGIMISLVLLWIEFSLKVRDPHGSTTSRDQQILNLVFGVICLCMMTVSICKFSSRVILNRMHGSIWRPRRVKATINHHFELFLQYMNIIVFIGENANAVKSWCNFFSPAIPWTVLIQWTLWNSIFFCHVMSTRNHNIWWKHRNESTAAVTTVQEPAILLEAPFWIHWPQIIIWVLCELSIVAVVVHYYVGLGSDNAHVFVPPPGVAESDCKKYLVDCHINARQAGLNGLMISFFVLYFAVFLYCLRKSFSDLRQVPYAEFKMAHLIIRLKVRLRLGVFCSFILSIVLLFFVKYTSCRAYVDTWLGLLPLHVAESISAVCWSFLTMPKSPVSKPPLLQVWLQEFSWTEHEMPKRLAVRNTAQSSGDGEAAQKLREKLAREPMFCFETAMAMLYWSALVYDYGQVSKTPLSVDEGMGLYGLTGYELFWEKASDVKMLLAWSRRNVVMSFRGTASMSNAWSDLQAYPTAHLPKRRHWYARPKVHSGFQRCFLRNGFSAGVHKRILALVQSGEVDRHQMKFHITGHSLGGALATLAAFAVSSAAQELGIEGRVNMCCYTFGAPRTGNDVWAREYEQLVPDTWHIINDQDAVPRSGKFYGMYKRGGHRVIINMRGDLAVRPLFIEASLQQVPGALSVRHHLLAAYTASLLEVLMGQYSKKQLRGGRHGVIRLVERSVHIQRLLAEQKGLTLKDLRRQLLSASAEPVAKLSMQQGRRSSSLERLSGLREWLRGARGAATNEKTVLKEDGDNSVSTNTIAIERSISIPI